MRNGFSIDRPILEGVHYLSRQEESDVRRKLAEDDRTRSNVPDMTLKADDSVLVEHIKQSVKEWQSLPKEKQDEYLNIPAENAKSPIPSVLNRYQVRLTHQTVRNEYPKLKTQGMGHFVQITNPTPEQQANEKEIREQMRERDIANAIGFRWIIEAIIGGDLSKMPHHYVQAGFPEGKAPKDIPGFLEELQRKLKSQRRALVGHNCLTDLINLYRCFIGDLPELVQDFSSKLHDLFPHILDTKYIAGLGNRRWADTSLKAVDDDLRSIRAPEIHVPPDFDRCLSGNNYHEAGFDSFVTARIGLKMLAKLPRERKDGGDVAQSGAARSDDVTHPDGATLDEYRRFLAGENVHDTTGQPTLGRGDLTKDVQSQDSAPKSVLEKVMSMSQKANIFNLLGDDPTEASEEQNSSSTAARRQRRIMDMMRKGQLMPRWEEDAEFWKLVSDKLQVNACQEGLLDLSQPTDATHDRA